ncbi:condensation domain-containing protein [Dactylosporangium sp. NPDC000244]|uniref:condensation domain-containing protein n=1 Tax=Dactylosporangium sp. NPDC000244 TaxID=3154365 RepID=UPI0033165A8F
MPETFIVAFRGDGEGVEELSWGQRELWGGMVRQRTWMPMGLVLPLAAGTTAEDVAAELRFILERFPSMRTRLRLRPDGPPQQVVAAAGEVAVELVDAAEDADPAAVAAEVSRRLHETVFDFERDWPVRTAVVRHRGALTHQVTVVCHLVNDGFGGLVLAEEVARWHRAGGLVAPSDAMPPLEDAMPPLEDAMSPLEQARWQRSEAGRRQSASALRHWEKTLRAIAPRRFPGPVDVRRPRHWQAGLASPALHLAAQVIARRTGTDRTTVLLTAFAVALSAETGIHPVVVRVVVSNRFRGALAGSVSPVSQPALCVLDVAGLPFDEAVALTGRRTLTAYKHAYYDPDDLDALVRRVNAERGEEVDIACYFNDRRPPAPADGPVPAAAEIRAALPATAFRWIAKQDRPNERMFVTIAAEPGTVHLDICGDTGHIPPGALEACARGIEAVTVAAATTPPPGAGSGRTP